jgi:hypothetical protein
VPGDAIAYVGFDNLASLVSNAIGQVESAAVDAGRPLVYFHGAYHTVAADSEAPAAGGSQR